MTFFEHETASYCCQHFTMPSIMLGNHFHDLRVQFVAVIQALLVAGKQLQQLHIEEEDKSESVSRKTVRSMLLRKLILTASSSTVISHSAKLLSALNKEAADRGDLLNLFDISSGQFPEVIMRKLVFDFCCMEPTPIVPNHC